MLNISKQQNANENHTEIQFALIKLATFKKSDGTKCTEIIEKWELILTDSGNVRLWV